jgi:hypothetical protein
LCFQLFIPIIFRVFACCDMMSVVVLQLGCQAQPWFEEVIQFQLATRHNHCVSCTRPPQQHHQNNEPYQVCSSTCGRHEHGRPGRVRRK